MENAEILKVLDAYSDMLDTSRHLPNTKKGMILLYFQKVAVYDSITTELDTTDSYISVRPRSDQKFCFLNCMIDLYPLYNISRGMKLTSYFMHRGRPVVIMGGISELQTFDITRHKKLNRKLKTYIQE